MQSARQAMDMSKGDEKECVAQFNPLFYSAFKSHAPRMAILRKREQEREMKELEEYAPKLGC